jgi:hypothetical protein
MGKASFLSSISTQSTAGKGVLQTARFAQINGRGFSGRGAKEKLMCEAAHGAGSLVALRGC